MLSYLQIHEELPFFITKLILQADDAKSYSYNFLLCAISLLNVVNKGNSLSTIEFIHTEIQDGKPILEEFCARCMKLVESYISVQIYTNKSNNIGTIVIQLTHLSQESKSK